MTIADKYGLCRLDFGRHEPDLLDTKIFQVLGDRVILKPLTRWNEAYKEFPRFVMEYLVSRYVDPTAPIAGQHKIDKILSEHLR